MEKQLSFNKDSKGHYVAEFISTGNSALQVCRVSNAALRVLAAIGELSFVPIVKFGDDSPKDLIFEVKIYSGVKVRIVSYSEVTDAKMITE